MVKGANQAFLKWKGSEKYLGIGRRAALRTGLAMRIDDSCEGVRPTRFPVGYEATIPSSSGAPVRSYFEEAPTSAPTLITVPQQHSIQIDALPPGSSVRISIPAPGAPTSILVEPRRPEQRVRVQEEVGHFDGWSDEEERVFLEDEASASEDSSNEEEPNPCARRSARRRRWCLAGCDCERPPGSRKCACERAGDHTCGMHCLCDPT